MNLGRQSWRHQWQRPEKSCKKFWFQDLCLQFCGSDCQGWDNGALSPHSLMSLMSALTQTRGQLAKLYHHWSKFKVIIGIFLVIQVCSLSFNDIALALLAGDEPSNNDDLVLTLRSRSRNENPFESRSALNPGICWESRNDPNDRSYWIGLTFMSNYYHRQYKIWTPGRANLICRVNWLFVRKFQIQNSTIKQFPLIDKATKKNKI